MTIFSIVEKAGHINHRWIIIISEHLNTKISTFTDIFIQYFPYE